MTTSPRTPGTTGTPAPEPGTARHFVIIGGVAGGMSAATRLRRLDEHAHILVLERGPYVSFANCGLPFHLSGVIERREQLLLQTPESLGERFRLDVRVQQEVTAIDRSAQTVTVRDAAGHTTQEPYDALIIATGVEARSSAGAGPESPATPVMRPLRTLDDLDELKASLDAALAAASPEEPPHALVLGGGFIGLEASENLSLAGARVTLVQRGPRVFPVLDAEMTTPIHEALEAAGIDVRLGTEATPSDRDPGAWQLSDGSEIRPALVVDARGVAADLSVWEAAGIRTGTSGGIVVDASHRTNDPAVYAVGDAAEKRDAVSGDAALITLAGLANRHGREAADAIAGLTVHAAPALGTAIIGLFGLAAGIVGWSETRLRAAGRAHRVMHTHPFSHAGYYPGAEQFALKLLVDPETDLILGAQAVGRDGVDKRLDVIATAIAGGLTATQLTQLELSYAPQFGSAKDPINLLGYVNDNLATGATGSVQWHELAGLLAAGEHLIDVRSPGEFAAGGIPGGINLPLDELRTRAGELPAGRLIVHCRVGQRGHTAVRLLRQLGFDAVNLDGGFLTWEAGTAAQARVSPAVGR